MVKNDRFLNFVTPTTRRTRTTIRRHWPALALQVKCLRYARKSGNFESGTSENLCTTASGLAELNWLSVCAFRHYITEVVGLSRPSIIQLFGRRRTRNRAERERERERKKRRRLQAKIYPKRHFSTGDMISISSDSKERKIRLEPAVLTDPFSLRQTMARRRLQGREDEEEESEKAS